jgi:hypothetical protein
MKGVIHADGDPALLPWLDGRGARLAGSARRLPAARRPSGRAITINGTEYHARDLHGTDQPSFTVTEKARRWLQDGGVDSEPVRVSGEEAAALQTFPSD